jgi:hypothetical protein
MSDGKSTYVTEFISKNVCPHAKGIQGWFKLPFITATLFITPVPWLLVGLLTLIFYLTPCNPNLNCTVITKKKDGQKAFIISLLIVYLLFFSTAILAKLLICNDTIKKFDEKDDNNDKYDGYRR